MVNRYLNQVVVSCKFLIKSLLWHYLSADKRILGIEIKILKREIWKLNLKKIYYLATNDFLAAGGDGYSMLSRLAKKASMDVALRTI